MKYVVFSIYDSKTEAYAQPFFMRTKSEAIRAFTDLAKDSNTQIAKHPADYALFEIAIYDDQTGIITSHAVPVSYGLAQEFAKPEFLL